MVRVRHRKEWQVMVITVMPIPVFKSDEHAAAFRSTRQYFGTPYWDSEVPMIGPKDQAPRPRNKDGVVPVGAAFTWHGRGRKLMRVSEVAEQVPMPDFLMVKVSDNGIAIDKEVLDNLKRKYLTRDGGCILCQHTDGYMVGSNELWPLDKGGVLMHCFHEQVGYLGGQATAKPKRGAYEL